MWAGDGDIVARAGRYGMRGGRAGQGNRGAASATGPSHVGIAMGSGSQLAIGGPPAPARGTDAAAIVTSLSCHGPLRP